MLFVPDKTPFILPLIVNDGEERPVQVTATEDGLLFDGIATIPWEWIEARQFEHRYGKT